MTPEQKQENFKLAEKIIAEQNFRSALVTGVLVMFLCVGVWAIAAALTARHLGLMAIVLGAAAGYVVQYFGKGVEVRFAVLAAALAVSGMLLGNLAAAILMEHFVFGATSKEIVSQLGSGVLVRRLLADIDLVSIAFWIMSISAAAYIANRRLNPIEALALFAYRYRDQD
ncbi:MAG: hypothetical protein HKM98_03765 [Gammaproteobacteria bacterium]|nr:hypothetical protein [Gammaproteobacteria bacterium]